VVEEGLSETRALLEEFNHVSMRMGNPNEDVDALTERFGELQQQIDNWCVSLNANEYIEYFVFNLRT
jgi:hypothetical protein